MSCTLQQQKQQQEAKKKLSRATLLRLDHGRPNVQKQKHMHLGLIQEDPKCRNRST
jgi:hypothetical protein